MNDDASSQSSMNSFKCSNYIYCDSCNEDEIGPTKAKNNHTRFCPREADLTKQFCNMRMDPRRCHGTGGHGCQRLTRIRSYVDVRRQQLQRSLVEEINKRRMFKTVGAIENIGFQNPEGGGYFTR